MDRESRTLLRRLLLDFVMLLAVGIPILLFFLFGKPYNRGFFCNDESLMHPFKDSTVTNTMLYLVGIFLPILVIILTEFAIYYQSRGHSTRMFMGLLIPRWVENSYKVIGVFGFGAACSQLTTDIAKYSIGRLRPHFFDVCKPNVNCSLAENQYQYIEDFTCTANQGTRMLKEVRLSFPSGHSSFSAYAMLFVAMYLQSRMTWSGSKLLKHFIQYLCLMLSWATAMTRISNYKHHWSDVLSGLIIGLVVSVMTVVFVSDLFPREKVLPELEPLNPEAGSRGNGKRGDSETPNYHSTYSQQSPVQHYNMPLHPISERNDSPSLTPLNQYVLHAAI